MNNKFFQKFVWYGLSTGVVFFVASLLFTSEVAFGNIILSPLPALVSSAIVVGLVSAVATEMAEVYLKKWSLYSQTLVFWAVNTAVIWILARTIISEYLAIGIAAFWIAAVLGLAVTVVQDAAWRLVSKNLAVSKTSSPKRRTRKRSRRRRK